MATALQRIEAATRRIERAAGRTAAHGDLARRYAALRREAGEALAEIDALIGELSR